MNIKRQREGDMGRHYSANDNIPMLFSGFDFNFAIPTILTASNCDCNLEGIKSPFLI